MKPKYPNMFISSEEFAQMEALLGRLLTDADSREQGLILHIHKRLNHMKQAQSSEQTTLDYLKKLA